MNRVVLIKSCRRYEERRSACTATWVGALRDAGISCRFFEGGHQETSYDAQRIYSTCDDTCIEHTGVTFSAVKLQAALRTLLRASDFEYVFVADDDTFAHPKRWLRHEPAGHIECRLFYPKSPADLKRRGNRPWVHGGAGWYMSRLACEMYCEATLSRAFGDDVTVARLMQSHNIAMNDRPMLYGGDRYSGHLDVEVSQLNKLITCHHVTPKRMRELYRELVPA